MKICIPTEDDTGLNARLSGHFGGAPYLTLIDDHTGGIEIIRQQHGEHGHGSCAAVDTLPAHAVQVLVCRGLGRRAMSRLDDLGVEVLACAAESVSCALAAYRAGQLHTMPREAACEGGPQHGLHH